MGGVEEETCHDYDFKQGIVVSRNAFDSAVIKKLRHAMICYRIESKNQTL